jgi:serine/threonine protein phosphatase 1
VTGYARDVFPDLRVDPLRFPACGETVHIWTRRREFLDPRCWTAPRPKRQRMVYGHTPTQASLPELAADGRRLNIATGAVYGGRLTGALLRAGEPDLFFRTRSPVLLQKCGIQAFGNHF